MLNLFLLSAFNLKYAVWLLLAERPSECKKKVRKSQRQSVKVWVCMCTKWDRTLSHNYCESTKYKYSLCSLWLFRQYTNNFEYISHGAHLFVFLLCFGYAERVVHFNFIQRSETSVCTQHCNFDLINEISRCTICSFLSDFFLLFFVVFFFNLRIVCMCAFFASSFLFGYFLTDLVLTHENWPYQKQTSAHITVYNLLQNPLT